MFCIDTFRMYAGRYRNGTNRPGRGPNKLWVQTLCTSGYILDAVGAKRWRTMVARSVGVTAQLSNPTLLQNIDYQKKNIFFKILLRLSRYSSRLSPFFRYSSPTQVFLIVPKRKIAKFSRVITNEDVRSSIFHVNSSTLTSKRQNFTSFYHNDV